jgi:hypothetical protein
LLIRIETEMETADAGVAAEMAAETRTSEIAAFNCGTLW